ncbi:MAG: hypothetical protein MO852_12005 [Candidatus Devosia euplotis]|nr:hypothetical protein [Candidatus Devosia euplotis]
MTAVYSPQQPWYQLPAPADFPDRVTPKWVGGIVHSDLAEAYLRWHLLPRVSKDSKYMGAWRTFWRTMAFADYGRGDDILRRWDERAAARLEDPGVSDEEAAIVRRCRGDVDGAINRLKKASDEPMSWAGAEFAKYPPEMRMMTESLIGAVVLHRAGEVSDEELYAVLDVLQVDPERRTRGIQPAARQRLQQALETGEPLGV